MNHAAQAVFTPEVKLATHHVLTITAFELVKKNLEGFGNTLGDEHQAALHELVESFTRMAFGLQKGRYAFPLPTGCGKTQSIVAWCAALFKLGYQGVSVAVSASKVEALSRLKVDLMNNGVPEEWIGLIHSYKPGNAILPATADNDDRPIMLVTHNRIHRGSLAQFNEYRGKPRNLLIWDESLLVSNAHVLSLRDLHSAFGYRKPKLEPGGREAIQFFTSAIAAVDAEMLRQERGEEPQTVELAPLHPAALAIIEEQIGKGTIEKDLIDFLHMAGEPLRVVHTQQGSGMVTYDITVPRALTTIAVLDASYPIRTLEQLDPTIQLGTQFSPDMKRYDHVQVHHLKASSGRHSMTRDFSETKRERRKVSAEVCNLIAGLPADEGVIVFTFKQEEGVRKAPDFTSLLQKDLRAAGVDAEAKLPEGDRIVFLSWGNETSLSSYSYCKHVVFAGVLHRSHLDLAGAMVGQADHLLHKVTVPSIKEVMNSEIAHAIYQALSRGTCRKISGNQAHAMHAWLIHRTEDIRPSLEKVMPGMQWVPWKGKYLTSSPLMSQLCEGIKVFLQGLPTSLPKISSTRIKKEADVLPQTSASTFTRAFVAALDDDIGWVLKGRSAVRADL